MQSTLTQTNITDLFRIIGRFAGQHYIEEKRFNGIFCKQSIWPNILFDVAFTLPELQKELPQMIAQIQQNELPGIIMFDPEFDTEESVDWLKEQSFRSGSWQAMLAPLNEIEQVVSELVIGLSDNLSEWTKCVESTLMGNKKLDSTIFEQLAKDPSVKFLEGRFNGELVATSLVFLREKSAGLFLVSTLEHYQKRGFGVAITRASKNLAFEHGCKQMFLHATKVGERTYEICSFESTGTVHVFDLRNKLEK